MSNLQNDRIEEAAYEAAYEEAYERARIVSFQEGIDLGQSMAEENKKASIKKIEDLYMESLEQTSHDYHVFKKTENIDFYHGHLCHVGFNMACCEILAILKGDVHE